jgi:hypothetical protein
LAEELKEFSFWAVIAFVLPGFFIVEARCIAARARIAEITKESVAAFVLVTVLYNFALWYFGIQPPTEDSILDLKPTFILKIYVLLPLILGFLWGLGERYYVVQKLLTPFGINAPLPVDSVWLEIFARQKPGTFLQIILKDGTVYNTVVTRESRFGSKGDEPDIYLAQTYKVNEQNKWIPSDPQRGVYVRGSEIKSIEIIAKPSMRRAP